MYALDRQEDVAMRLNGCACMYKGRAHLIRVVSNLPINVVQLTPMRAGSSKPVTVEITDPDFFVTGYNLGYINSNGFRKKDVGPGPVNLEAIYCMRSPYREQRQGLHSSNTRCYSLGGRAMAPIFNERFADMLENVYPSYQHALRLCVDNRDRVVSCAFHKDWAISVTDPFNVQLRHRQDLVGNYDFKKEAMVLDTDIPGVSYLIPDLRTTGCVYTLAKGDEHT